MKISKLNRVSDEVLESYGLNWHTDIDSSKYISSDSIIISEKEMLNYENAGNELYNMYVNAAQYVIDNNLFQELNIPYNLIDMIKHSWENERHWHIYGRFDFAGGLHNKQIKLIEFNADTPTSLYETAIIQNLILKENNLDETKQFNLVYESIVDNFKRLISPEDISLFQEKYKYEKILFSPIYGSSEDEMTVRLLQQAANDAGFITEFCYADVVEFNNDGIYYNGAKYEYWFKLIPWETIAIDEGNLTLTLTKIVCNNNCIILNPAYTLLFQSKGIMKILWDLYPNHPLLLESSYVPLKNKKYVKKSFLSREGSNVTIYDENNNIIEEQSGEYGNFKMLYQEYVDLNQDFEGNRYQAGVFYSYQACGLGYRKGGLIMNNMSKFVPHMYEQKNSKYEGLML